MKLETRWTCSRICSHAAMLMLMLFLPAWTAAAPGDPSLSDQAELALDSGRIELARDLYARWLEADPSDYIGWYNYTCTLSLLGDTTAALEALKGAVEAGWRDSTWAADDPDLVSLRGQDAFAEQLKRMGHLRRLERGGSVYKVVPRYIERVDLAPYLLILPKNYDASTDKAYPLVLLLHDRGQDMDAMRDLVNRLALPDVIYALPRAPYPMEAGGRGFEYWPRDLALSGNRDQAAQVRDLTGAWYGSLVKHIEGDVRVDSSHVFVIGYSQGGAAAFLAAMKAPDVFCGIGLLGGYIPESHRDSTLFQALGERNVALFIGHGSRDREVGRSEAARARDLAEAGGMPVTFRMYPAEHSLPDEMVVDLADWIEGLCNENAEEPQDR